MIGFLFNLLLALSWLLLTNTFTLLNVLFGFALGFLVIALIHRTVPALYFYPKRLPRALHFALFFIKELVVANWRVATDIVTPIWYMHPGVIALPLTAKTEFEIALVANIISLTPGTLSMDVSDDKKTLFVHAMFLDDEEKLRGDLKEIEQRLLQVLR
jgi:multicomponent Na+:H+ antiporter subunit E